MYRLLTLFISALIFGSMVFFANCSSNSSDDDVNDNFDRGAMLQNWADNIIVPGYEAYFANLSSLKTAIETFSGSKTTVNLQGLQDAWLDAYVAWQYVSMFEIGKAETISLRDFTNIFPTNAALVESNIANGGYNLQLPSSRDQQGFPALDYLLYGIGSNHEEIVDKHVANDQYTQYTSELINRLIELTEEVLDDWKGGYRDNFVLNDGSESSSSVNKLVNDYLFYYEKALRAGKIGLPAGVFSTTPLPDRVEGLYAREVSKQLFDAALQATIDFFNGKHYNAAANGESLDSYLDYLSEISSTESISKDINNQFVAAQQAASVLDDNFHDQVQSNNQLMLLTYDELQKNVILMKVDMLQAMNISVDYVDADGD
jgi:predicted lipoprotein